MNPDIQATNAKIIDQITSGQEKQAAENFSKVLRLRAREDGFLREILPPETITPNMLTKQMDTDMPAVVLDMEPNSTTAYDIAFGTGSSGAAMVGPRYRITMHRLATDRYQTDVEKLKTYDMDLKDVFSDLMLKDLMDEEDRKFIAQCDVIVGDLNDTNTTTNSRLANTGALGFITAGSVSREALFHARSGLPATSNKLPPSKSLVNVLFLDQVAALGREALGGDLAEDVFVNSWTKANIAGLDTTATIKHDIVPNKTQYIFAAPKYMGKFLISEDVTVSFKQEDYFIMLRAYESIGCSIRNEASVAKVQYTGTLQDWTP